MYALESNFKNLDIQLNGPMDILIESASWASQSLIFALVGRLRRIDSDQIEMCNSMSFLVLLYFIKLQKNAIFTEHEKLSRKTEKAIPMLARNCLRWLVFDIPVSWYYYHIRLFNSPCRAGPLTNHCLNT